jgi:hypothetical protein
VTKLSISQGATDPVVEEDDEDLKQAGTGVVVEEDGDEGAPKGKLPARARLNDDGSVTLPLTKPVTLTISKAGKERQETYVELTFHELTGLDLRLVAQEKDEMKQTIVTLARATKTSVGRMNVLFDRLSQRDVKGATDIISYFQE